MRDQKRIEEIRHNLNVSLELATHLEAAVLRHILLMALIEIDEFEVPVQQNKNISAIKDAAASNQGNGG